jgi:polyhydroxyalkanoate synthesis repressor PhaR
MAGLTHRGIPADNAPASPLGHAGAVMSEPRVIKRYANRKMYDTTRSCYVTLEEIAEIVRQGTEIHVIDNKTKQDLTEVTLTQALLDSERKQRGTVPLAGLRHLISSGNEFITRKVAEPVSRVKEGAERWRVDAERTITAFKTEAEKRAEKLLHRRGEEGVEADGKMETPKTPGIVEQTQRAADELTHKLDDHVRQVAGALGLRGQDDEELVALRKRVQELEALTAALEARIANLESARQP